MGNNATSWRMVDILWTKYKKRWEAGDMSGILDWRIKGKESAETRHFGAPGAVNPDCGHCRPGR